MPPGEALRSSGMAIAERVLDDAMLGAQEMQEGSVETGKVQGGDIENQ